MKLTLWQQFSSNHSSGYTVVGRFENADAARKAGEQLRDILTQIAEWHQEYYDKNGKVLEQSFDFPPLTPVEEALGQQFGIDWEQGVGWATSQDDTIDRVRISNNLVVVSSPITHFIFEQPFSALIEKMGGESFVATDFVSEVLTTITCNAPDMETTNALKAILEEYFKAVHEKKYDMPPPWGGRWGANEGEIDIKGTTIQLLDLKIGLPDTLDSIRDFLRAKGCQDIEYRLIEHYLPQENAEG